jgi:DNA helicase HerA-like ATPase
MALENRYVLYITKFGKDSVENRQYAEKHFANDVVATTSFRKLVRDDLLKKYESVEGIVKCGQREVKKFVERRLGEKQRMLQFLQRW